MEFAENIYTNIKDYKKILKQLKKNKIENNIYCICVDKKSNSILEILHSREIFKQVYSNQNYIVIGIADSKKEALKIVCDIIENIYKQDNNLTDIKNKLIESCTRSRV